MLTEFARQLGVKLQANNQKLAVAESCTGGLLAQVITAVPGCSQYFEGAFITYSNAAKETMLGVNPKTIQQYGAVSLEVAREMAEGVLAHSQANLSMAITGIAGPGGGTPDKPVGTVCFAVARTNRATISETKYFSGERDTIRQASVQYALELLYNC